MWVFHNVSICVIVDRLVIMTNTSVNILVNICWCTWARIWDCIYLEMDFWLVSFAYFNLVNTPKQFSRVTEPICTPTFSLWEFLWLHIFIGFLKKNYSSWYSHVCFHVEKCYTFFAKKGKWPFREMDQVNSVASPVPKWRSSTKLTSWRFFIQSHDLLAFHQTVSYSGTSFPPLSVKRIHCWPLVYFSKTVLIWIILFWSHIHLFVT